MSEYCSKYGTPDDSHEQQFIFYVLNDEISADGGTIQIRQPVAISTLSALNDLLATTTARIALANAAI